MRDRQRDPTETRFWIKMGAAVLVGLMVTVWEHVTAVRLERELKALHKEHDRLTYENGRLQMQIHQWTAPSNLDALARKNYGLMPADSAHIVGVTR
jgi:cell division protein FtsL